MRTTIFLEGRFMNKLNLKIAIAAAIYAFLHSQALFAEDTVENSPAPPSKEERQAKRDQIKEDRAQRKEEMKAKREEFKKNHEAKKEEMKAEREKFREEQKEQRAEFHQEMKAKREEHRQQRREKHAGGPRERN